MFDYGRGRCKNTPYAQGDENEEACKALCIQEKQCKFASYYTPVSKRKPERGEKKFKGEKLCLRYKDETCQVDATYWFKNFWNTVIKKGLLRFIEW